MKKCLTIVVIFAFYGQNPWKSLVQTYINLIKFDILVSPFHILGTNFHGLHLETEIKESSYTMRGRKL